MFLIAKIVLSLTLAGVAAWGLFSWEHSAKVEDNAKVNANVESSGQVEQNTNTSTSGEVQLSAGVSTDAALQADLSAIDSQLQAATNDSASIDASMNDKPVGQTE